VLCDNAVLRIQGTLTGLSWMNYESLGTGKLLAVADRNFRGHKSSTSELIDGLAEMKQPLQRSLNNVGDITQTVKDTTLGKVNTTLGDFDHTAVDVRAQIDPAFKKYHAIGDHAIAMMDKIGAFFGDATTDFRGTIANANKLTHTFNEKLPSLLDRVNGILVSLDTSVKSANQALEDIKITLANGKDISATARSVIVGNKGKFETMISALKATSDNLKNATAEVRRSPWRLLYKPNPGEMANLNLYDATRQFADGATDLNDAALALRDAVNDKDIDKEQLQKLMDKLDKSFTNFTAVEQTLWEKVKE
jgi:ABC-type transporter Mla subunit MlaD